ncbi:MAG: undecaprenyl/decaprenyl-phosphate alpha-N-acetylglucosaminyl 1-phosphate transferase [Alphaproteobacteria bacterium]|nr:undecaprenyl/decaprenyl-phosphate alpha-N-acetylglucosaminyl 1-phosphate transferase [Alphaproteobacteria bacterium]
MPEFSLPFLAIVGFIAALVLLYAGRNIALHFGLVDRPGGRKQHEGAVPLMGGLVILPVFALLTLISGLYAISPISYLIGGVLFLLSIGFLDDKFHIHAWVRFVIQIWVACYVVVFCDAALYNLGNLFGFGEVDMGPAGKPFAVVCLVLLMNAINMMDGLDGLAAGFVTIAIGWLALAAYNAGSLIQFSLMICLIAPLLAFLVFNARYPFHERASVFLGDGGSLALALLLGWLAISCAQIPETSNVEVQILSPVVIIWIMSVPIIDTFAIFFVRMKQGRSPFEADRLHLHHKILDSGIPAHWATPIIWGIAVVTGGIGYLASQMGVPDYILLYSWSALWLGYTAYRLKHA